MSFTPIRRRYFHLFNRKHEKGQSFVELALTFVLLIILLGSVVEFGFMFMTYLGLQEVARNSARYSSDGLYYFTDNIKNCDSSQGPTTKDFFRSTACAATLEIVQERPLITLTETTDDVVISAWGIKGAGYPGITNPQVAERYPTAEGERGYSMMLDWYGRRNFESRLTTEFINSHLQSGAPSTGILAVEIFYAYYQKLKLPWITAVVPDPLILHAYAIMPLVSAEPKAP